MTGAAFGRLTDLLAELGISVDPQLLQLALTHRSWAYEHGATPHNERLEFLGDSVLGVVVTEHLYRTFPHHTEGALAKLRSAVVNTAALADVARDLGIGPAIRLGKGETSTGGSDKASILADTLEALLGAVHLSCGREAAASLVHRLFDDVIAHAEAVGAGLDWKTSLQERCSLLGLPLPRYEHSSTGPDHDKRYAAVAVVGDRRFPAGLGRSKKVAEQGAARAACDVLGTSPAHA